MTHVVAAIIIDQMRGFLCGLRDGKHKGWEFIGGKVEHGETHEEALKREVSEEIGCEIKVQKHFMTVKHGTLRLDFYVSELLSGEPQCTVHKELRWVRAEDLHGLKWLPADKPIINKLRG